MNLNFQYAHHTHHESESVSGVSDKQALEAFDEFDWIGESDRAQELQKCAPTLSVISEPEKKMIWVSSMGTGDNIQFVSECMFPGQVSAWFGLSKKLGTVHLHVNWFSISQARNAIELYLRDDFEALRSLYEGV